MTRLRAVLALAAAALGVAAAPAQAAPSCAPFAPPQFRGQVPTARSVLGIDLGERDVTTAESDRYLQAVDAASDRVISGVLATSVQGRPLRYAIVGRRRRVTRVGLARVRAAAARLQDPSTPAREAARIVRRDPEILWIAANVHGNEESGTDASLRVLYELADRRDCAAKQILDDAIVVILPIQNPDGREADTRRNAYGFDMNRDWFARTQPETDGKVEMLRRLPPVLFIDAHEMGTPTYFFPPNADPIYHEISDQSVSWINGLYGPAIQREFDARGILYFNYQRYDLFYMGYGDTVPSTGFNAAGMTFEKNDGEPASVRVFQQYLTQWTSLSQAAIEKRRILAGWHDAWVQAEAQGEAGRLEPNEVVQPENQVQRQVPDMKVRHYFLRADDPAKARDVRALVRRLQRMDVTVRRLTAPLTVPDFRAYGRPAAATTLPAGTYWIAMAQRQKHWVQAMLNEDTYTPFPYFYDVTAWSQPLLFNVEGGFSGAALRPHARRLGLLADPGPPPPPAQQPRLAIFQISATSSTSIESSGWLRWLLDRWGLRHRTVSADDIRAGGLSSTDVLMIPNGSAATAVSALGADGARALADWVGAGGRLVAWSGGGALAAQLGLSTARFTDAGDEGLSVPGTMFRVIADAASPLAAGVGRFAYAYHLGDYVMREDDPAKVAVRYPPASSPDFFSSGYQEGGAVLGDTAAVVDERVGDGRAVVFGFEPNFRAFTTGTQRLLRNALLGPEPPAAATAAPSSGAVRAARADARSLSTLASPLRLTVRARGERAARRVLGRFGARYELERGRGRVTFLVANPGERTGDEHQYAARLPSALRAARVPVVLFRAP